MLNITVPLTIQKVDKLGFHLLVDIKLKGNTYQLVLDTGASQTALDMGFVQSIFPGIDIEEVDGASAGVGSSKIDSWQVQIPLIEIGELRLKKYKIAALDLTHVMMAYEVFNLPKIHGVLGGDILQKYQAIINYRNLTLTLHLT
ncbi:MAG: hypothetical protein ACJAZ3_001417 [Sphingobacteriales bacterium]|jgi:hypothetical protein